MPSKLCLPQNPHECNQSNGMSAASGAFQMESLNVATKLLNGTRKCQCLWGINTLFVTTSIPTLSATSCACLLCLSDVRRKKVYPLASRASLTSCVNSSTTLSMLLLHGSHKPSTNALSAGSVSVGRESPSAVPMIPNLMPTICPSHVARSLNCAVSSSILASRWNPIEPLRTPMMTCWKSGTRASLRPLCTSSADAPKSSNRGQYGEFLSVTYMTHTLPLR
mmetsp:Transcript_13562/g.32279  ORF Transcript_13562/g.32279 Transcript_13562/m.32279 type:complete len:222 (-) Transcript_13562:459-1124(-)